MRNSGLKSKKRLSSGKSLGGGGRLASRVGLKFRSKKMQQTYEEERVPFVKDYLARNPYCAFKLYVIAERDEDSPHLNAVTRNTTRCPHPAVDVHEILPRSRGGNIVPIDGDESNFLGLCRRHHVFVTTHPLWSKTHGYSR